MTGTSGPGVALKSEAIGLASMAEIPLVIVNVMRGGPSTGLPTKFEQSDLAQALYGTHGDAVKAVIAPTDVADTFVTGNLAFQIAEKYQMPVLLLTDQFLSARMESTTPFDLHQFEVVSRATPKDNEEGYLRYKNTKTGVSPISAVGQPGVIYQTSGLEHFESGRPTSELDLHQSMSEQRELKLKYLAEEFDYIRHKEGKSKVGVITWGSSSGAVREAVDLLAKDGMDYSFIIPQLISPLPKHKIQPLLDTFDKLVVVELSFSGQFHKYLKSELNLPKEVVTYKRAGGKPLNVSEIYNVLKKEYI
jgi:2-oxoglutarate ferredoxin oxidoreductase subunit alpha